YVVSFGAFFFFQAEDGIRDRNVTGVQTCALPIWCRGLGGGASVHPGAALLDDAAGMAAGPGQTGGEQGDVEAVAVHRSAGTGAGAGWVRSRPVQALSPLCSRSRASTARSTR